MFYTLLKIQQFFEACYQTLISFLRILLRFRYRNTLKPHRVANRNLIILGNGPSLKESIGELKREANTDLMAVNQFVLSAEFDRMKPENYVLLDIGFFNDNTIPRVKEISEKLAEGFIEKTSWAMKLFIPVEGRGSKLHQKVSTANSNIEFVFFKRTNVEGLKSFRHWAYSRNLGMPKPSNVLIGCLMLGICMAYKELILVGADHTWLENIRVGEDNSLISVEKHFYDKDKKGKPTRKEHPDTKESMKLHDYLNDLSRTFSAYHVIRKFAERKGTRIINASKVSYIDAFERLR
jgi:hypothetical protein